MALLKSTVVVICLVAAQAGISKAMAAGVQYDCDTAANHYSELVLPVPEGNFDIVGRIKLKRIAESDKYAPFARLELINDKPAGTAPSVVAGFKLTVMPEYFINPAVKDRKRAIQAFAMSKLNAGATTPRDVVGYGPVGQEMAFSFHYAGGAVSVLVGDKEEKIAFAASKAAIRVFCSTGEFLFSDLVIAKAE